MKPITVLIVDDSALIRKLYSELLSDVEDIQVVGTAVHAQDAREKIKQLNPQVLTLDIEMPGMDGIAFLEKIMSLRPMPVIMASTLTQKGAAETLRALEIGAVDYISKPTGASLEEGMAKLREDLVAKIRIASRVRIRARPALPQGKKVLAFHPAQGFNPIIAIGSSTGGVEALRDIFLALPANVPPIVMAQHMPEQFTSSFATRLNSLSQVEVAEATHGAKLKPGHAYLARGNHHLKVKKIGQDYVCQLEDSKQVSGHRPSVDVLFNSVAEAVGPNAVGVILTGMGQDGAAGMLRMREQGAYNIGQDESSCIVYGMPKVAMTMGAVHKQAPLSGIAALILACCEQKKAGGNAA